MISSHEKTEWETRNKKGKIQYTTCQVWIKIGGNRLDKNRYFGSDILASEYSGVLTRCSDIEETKITKVDRHNHQKVI